MGKPAEVSLAAKSQAADVKDSRLKLPFMNKKDIFNTWGQLRFGATRI